jgi:hypothetical protein
MFTLPYLKIELPDKRVPAHRQTASAWLKKMAEPDIIKAQKIERPRMI